MAKGTVAFLFFFVGSILASSVQKLSEPQTTALLAEIMKYTLQNPHNSKQWRWVLLNLPEKQFPELSANIRKEMATKYTVYAKPSDVPGEERSGKETYSYTKTGFELSIEIRQVAPDWIKITYQDYEGPLAGSKQTIQYQWVGSEWKVVSQSDMIIY